MRLKSQEKLVPTTRKLITPQGHRCVIAQEIVHPVITNCTFQLGPPTQSTRFIHRDGVDVGTCSFVTNVLAVVNMDVGAAGCEHGCLTARTYWIVHHSYSPKRKALGPAKLRKVICVFFCLPTTGDAGEGNNMEFDSALCQLH